MIKFNVLFLFFVLIQQFSLAQKCLIRGSIIDAETKIALPFSIITLSDQKIFTIADSNGNFSLYTEVPTKADTLLGYSMGYNTAKMFFSSCPDKPINLELIIAGINLNEISIKPLSPKDILDNVLLAIPKNYSSEHVWCKGYYRQKVQEDSAISELSEMVINFKKTPYNSKAVDSCELVKGRSFKEKDGHMGFINGLPRILKNDVIKYLPDFLSPAAHKKYDYALESPCIINNHNVYVISFDQKDIVKDDLFKGKIYIDINSFAIIKVEYFKSPKGLPYWKMSKKDAFMVRKTTGCEIESNDLQGTVTYIEINSKWYLNSIITSSSSKMICSNNTEYLSSRSGNLFITELLPDIRDVDRKKLLNPHLPLKLQLNNEDSDFWKDFNVVILK